MILRWQWWLTIPFRRALVAIADADGTILKKTSNFLPIPALWNNTNDILLFFLSSHDVKYLEACYDPWFAATIPIDTKLNATSPWGNPNVMFYVGDEPARVLGCVSRYQFCNARSNKSKPDKSCTPLAKYSDVFASLDALWQIDEQRSFFDAWIKNIWIDVNNIAIITFVAGIAFLKTRDSLSNDIQNSLLYNQWQLKIEYWYNAILTDRQKLTVKYTTGSLEPALLQIFEATTDKKWTSIVSERDQYLLFFYFSKLIDCFYLKIN